MILNFAYYGDPILRKKAKPITQITSEVRQLVANMIETLESSDNGIGLAAPQVHVSLAVFIVQFRDETFPEKWVPGPIEVHMNPQLLEVDHEKLIHSEGCLSIPKVYADVPRPKKIKLQSINLDGQTVIKEYEGYNARMILHENDHLNGIPFIDRISSEERKDIEAQLRAIKKQYKKSLA